MTKNIVSEWTFHSRRTYQDPFNEVDLDVLVTDPAGCEYRVPAFWAGNNTWRVRLSSNELGLHHWQTVCSDTSNARLHHVKGQFHVTPYTGNNPLHRHGPIQVAHDHRHFQHADGTPFFWLADTWWMALCHRLRWPNDFHTLALDRVEKGFTVIQLVAGLYPDMPHHDPRGANEAGHPWNESFTRINPAYFDFADRRIAYLVDLALAPCIVGAWGYFMTFMGPDALKKHWRYLIARYAAYPVLWCAAGEALLPFYQSDVKEKNALDQYIAQTRADWTDVTRCLRDLDPYRRPLTIHPSTVCPDHIGRDMVDDDTLLDFDMLQPGHNAADILPHTTKQLEDSLHRKPAMPTLIAEVCYEGLAEMNRQEIQRLYFWCGILAGAGGHTYGANGIWQVNTREEPFGPSPTGTSWGDTPWQTAYQLPGSESLALAKKLLQRYPWWKLEPHGEWVHQDHPKNNAPPFAAGIPQKLRILYYHPAITGDVTAVKHLEPNTHYRAFLFNPSDAVEHDLGRVAPNKNRTWTLPTPPVARDWVIVLEAT